MNEYKNENEYEISLHLNTIDFKPDSIHKEIIQNVITICTTPKGSRPLDRDFGVTPAVVDMPLASEQSRITSEIITAVNKYEPRAKISEVSFAFDEGIMYPIIKVICL